MQLLFLSRWFPYPPDNGSKLRIYNLIKALAAEHQLDLVSFTEAEISEKQLSALSVYCRQVHTVPYRPFRPHSWKSRLGFFSLRPRSVIDTYSSEIAQKVAKLSTRTVYDGLIASQVDMAIYAPLASAKFKLFEEVELTSLWEQSRRESHPLERLRKRLMWWKTRRYLAQSLAAFDGCTVVSKKEELLLRSIFPKQFPIAVIPNGVDAATYTQTYAAPEPDTLIYSGSLTYQPNFDAVSYFLSEIYPLIQARRPSLKLVVTGKNDDALIARLPQHRNIHFTGYVEDVRPLVAQSWASIVPLRLGGGTRLKILEALALGTPVISTSKGAEGLDLENGREILLADTPQAFAAAVSSVLSDLSLRTQLGDSGRRKVLVHYSWQTIGQTFNQFLAQLMPPTR